MLAAPRTIAWDELLQLRVVRQLVGVIERRWSLGVGHAEVGGAAAEAPRPGRDAPERGWCSLIQSRPVGDGACTTTARRIGAKLTERRGAADAQAFTLTCHAG